MATADDDLSLGRALALLLGVSSPVIAVAGYQAYRTGRLARGWRRLRVWALGGATTLDAALAYGCDLCGGGLDAREEVRTLSCGHVFHLRKSAKCGNNIDDWLRQNRMRCPVCRKVALPVSPWKAPPTSAPSSSAPDLEDPLVRQRDPLPAASSSGSQEPPLPVSTMASWEEAPLSLPVPEEASLSSPVSEEART